MTARGSRSNSVVSGPPAGGCPVVAVGGSAGGLEALDELLRHLPGTGLALVVILHPDPAHPVPALEALARATPLPVREIEHHMPVEPDHVYVMPAHAEVGLRDDRFALGPRRSGTRADHRPIDGFCKVLALERANLAIGIVLSGTGPDGTEGLEAIKAEGGITLAQAPESARFDGMPRSAIDAGAADAVLAPAALAGELERLARHPLLYRAGEPVPASSPDAAELDKVLVLLRAAAGIDVAEYRLAGLHRRVTRRMVLRGLASLPDYVRLLREDRAEVSTLCEEILSRPRGNDELISTLKQALDAAERARDYARATVEAVHTPLLVLDARHEISSVNRAFHDQFQPEVAVLEGLSLYALLDGAFAIPELRAALARVFDAGAAFENLEAVRELRGLGPRALAFGGRTIPTARGDRLALLAIEDVTERRRADAERARLLELAESSKASAEQANRAKDMFLAVLSHELRTPLSAVIINAQVLLQLYPAEQPIQKSAQAIERAATAQAQLIDDLLDVSRIASGKLRMELQAVSLTGTARVALEMVAPAAARGEVNLEVSLEDDLPLVPGDPARLQQVIWNLLSNAIKFTPARGTVRLTLDAVDHRARIRVTDTGAGIEPEFLEHVFEPFSQEDRERTRSHGGMGLGLGIVLHVVEAHGGTVVAESEGKGKGSTFTVLLPVMARGAPAADRRAERHEALDIEGARVLVVEDDPGTREALIAMLGLARAEVRAATSAASALVALAEFEPELLVCDIAMPDQDGYTLLRQIRGLGPEHHGDIPALALTALAGPDDRRRAFEAGFDVHLAKPVEIDRLVAELARLRNR